jgi:hypothetical protein
MKLHYHHNLHILPFKKSYVYTFFVSFFLRTKKNPKKKMNFNLIKTQQRKSSERICSNFVSFDNEKNQINLGKKISNRRFKAIFITDTNEFRCIVPLYKYEYIFLITKQAFGFSLNEIINIIIKLTIAVYALDIALNPSNYNTNNNKNENQMAIQIANEYVLSKIYYQKKQKTIYYDFDH